MTLQPFSNSNLLIQRWLPSGKNNILLNFHLKRWKLFVLIISQYNLFLELNKNLMFQN